MYTFIDLGLLIANGMLQGELATAEFRSSRGDSYDPSTTFIDPPGRVCRFVSSSTRGAVFAQIRDSSFSHELVLLGKKLLKFPSGKKTVV